jgi:pimeloyl-ACP methyl ester carboxylesterase
MAFVLVHGGAHTGGCWSHITPQLDAKALALDLPGRGSRPAALLEVRVDDWVDAIVEEIEAFSEEPIVLVGHSLAGMSLPRVAERIPERLAHLVFISATVPPEGRTPIEMLTPEIQAIAQSEDPNSQPSVLPEAAARAMFCNDMDEEQTRFVLDGLVPEAPKPIHEPSRLAGLANGIPITWLRNLRDAVVSMEQQDIYIETIRALAPVEVVDVDAGHNSLVSQPEQIARILNRIHEPR